MLSCSTLPFYLATDTHCHAAGNQRTKNNLTSNQIIWCKLSESCSVRAWRKHKSLTSSYVLMLSMGIERCSNYFLALIFSTFWKKFVLYLFFLILFFKCGGTLVVLVRGQERKWTLIKRHMFVGGFQFCDLWQAWITISIFFIFQCLVYKALWSAYSQHSYYQYQCLSTSTYRIWELHSLATESILVSLARATSIALMLGLQHFSKVGHMRAAYSNVSNPSRKHFLIRCSQLLKFTCYVQFFHNKKFQSIVFFI